MYKLYGHTCECVCGAGGGGVACGIHVIYMWYIYTWGIYIHIYISRHMSFASYIPIIQNSYIYMYIYNPKLMCSCPFCHRFRALYACTEPDSPVSPPPWPHWYLANSKPALRACDHVCPVPIKTQICFYRSQTDRIGIEIRVPKKRFYSYPGAGMYRPLQKIIQDFSLPSQCCRM